MANFSNKRVALLLAVVFVLAAMAMACAPEEEVVEPVEPEEEGPVKGGTIRIALYSGVDSMDPHLARTTTHNAYAHTVTDSLVLFGDDNQIHPWLAEDWDVSEDGKTYTFYLQEGVVFHNDESFDAEAVKFNLERILTDDYGAAAAALSDIEEIEVVDEYTVRIRLSEVDVNFLQTLSGGSAGMVAPEAAAEMGEDFAEDPVGLGPFKLVTHIPDERIELERFEDYWRGEPYLDGVVLRPVPEETTRVVELEACNVDMITYAPPKDVERLKDAGYINLERGLFNSHALVFNVERPTTSDVQVRKAISYAIDHETIIEEAFAGWAVRSITGIPEETWGHNDELEGYHHDPDKAAELLEEAGWELEDDGYRYRDGEKLELQFPTGEAPMRVLITEIIQDQLRRVGVHAEIEVAETGTYYSNMRAGDYDISYWIIIGGRPDPSAFTLNLHSEAYWNVSQLADARIDEALDKGVQTPERDERKEHYDEFQRIVLEEAYVTWLVHELTPNFIKDHVRDLQLAYNNVFYLHEVWLDE